MRINNQLQTNRNSLYKNKTRPSFSSNGRMVISGNGNFNLNTTWFFRKDLPWNEFVDSIIEKYKNATKVHIRNYACSEGAESFSIAMLLMKKLGIKQAQKFFPIIASDCDEAILKNPKNGIVKVSQEDISRIRTIMGEDYTKFIDINPDCERDSTLFIKDDFLGDKVCQGRVKQPLKDVVIFENRDITKSVDEIEDDNCIVLCRSFWPYINDVSKAKLANDLAKKLNNSSICVIGEIDYKLIKPVSKLLIESGFKTADYGNGYCFIK